MKKITPEMRQKLEYAGHITRKTCSYIGMGVMTIFLICIITGCIVGTAMGIYIMKFVNPDDTINLRDQELNYTSVLYVTNENGENEELQRLHGTENRIWADLEQIPQIRQSGRYYFKISLYMEEVTKLLQCHPCSIRLSVS